MLSRGHRLLSHVKLDRLNDQIAVITLNRPEKHNALSFEMAEQIISACQEVDSDSSVRAVILKGEGKSFCSGRDLKASLSHSPDEAEQYLQQAIKSVRSIYNLKVPTIAAIHGSAIGYGLELAIACDIRFARPDANLALPETSLGIFPGAGGSYMLPSILGNTSIAMDWILTGRKIHPEEALKAGLLSSVCHDPFEEAKTTATLISRNGPLGVQAAKRVLRERLDQNMFESGWSDRVFEERAKLTRTEDHKEALKAFQEKRKPVFVGK